MALTEEQLRAFVPRNYFLKSPYTAPVPVEEEEEVTTSYGIPNTDAFTGGGNNYTGSPNELVENYQSIVDARQKRLNNPSDTFLGFNTMKDQQLTGADAGEYIGSGMAIPQQQTMMGKVQDFFTPQSADQIISEGYEEPRFQPGIIGTLAGKIDKYRHLTPVDQAFIAQNMGYTGPTVFGDNNSGLSKDVYGINTRSMFGNYADYVDKAAQLDMTDEEYAALTKFNKQKVDFYRAKVEEKKVIEQKEAEKLAEEGKIRLGDNLVQDTTYKSDPALSKEGKEKYTGEGMAFEKTSGGVSGKGTKDERNYGGRKDGGRVGLRYGGLLSIL